jgi:hypothetical protein
MQWIKAVLGSAMGRQSKRSRASDASSVRARAPAVHVDTSALDELRAELRTRIVEHTDERAPHALRHLVLVHDELGRSGWTGVESFPARVVAKARVQAEMLSSLEPSPVVIGFVERLRLVEVAARLREEESRAPGDEKPAEPEVFADSEVEVSQGSSEEYELLERSWIGTVPAGLERPVGRS